MLKVHVHVAMLAYTYMMGQYYSEGVAMVALLYVNVDYYGGAQ